MSADPPEFIEYQARVRANLRMHTEADLYWRTNRWDPELQPNPTLQRMFDFARHLLDEQRGPGGAVEAVCT
jgi:hypothetical protein